MANEHGEPFVLDFPNGQRVEDILKKAEANYSKAEIDMKMSSKANSVDVYNKTEVDAALRGKVDKVSGKGLSTNDYTTADKEKLAGIETQANKTVVDDTLDNTSTNPVQNKVVKAALDNKADTADIPTVPITAIQKNGTGITPVSGTVNITVPTQASDINAATATQGDKADTAIQGIKVNSSTVNPDANKVVNITIPTTAADVSALPDTTKYAVALSLTINSSTYVMTGQLKDQNGDNLGTAQTIDLPLESVVVGGSYNSQTKKVVLTLQNGNTIEFSVADLVSGLQTELSTSNKLNPAFIEYDSTHRAVSDTEKSAWNSKQNALSSTQLDAVNSGITSADVEQIEMNKNNILLVADQSTKYNYINTIDVATLQSLNTGGTWNNNVYSIDTVTMTINSDGTITVTTSDETTVGVSLSFPTSVQLTNNNYYLFGCPTGGSAEATNGYFLLYEYKRGETTYYKIDTGNGVSFNYATGDIIHTIRITLRPQTSIATPIIFKPQLLLKTLYDAGFTTYQPYAMSNAELTAKEQQNEDNISSQQDTVAQGGNGYAIINGIRQYTGDTIAPPVPPNSLWLKDSVKVKTDNYFNVDDFSAIQVDAQGNKRCGTNCGILSQGTYTLSATTSALQNNLFHTIKSGTTYTLVTIDSLPYTFTADGVSEQIIRVANATTTSWGENGYTNIMLNTGDSAQSYVPYWSDKVQEQVNWNSNNGVKNILSVPNMTCDQTIVEIQPIPAGNYIVSGTTASTTNCSFKLLNASKVTLVDVPYVGNAISEGLPVTITETASFAKIWSANASDTVSNLMIRPAIIDDNTYRPYALSNAELTAKEQSNENNILMLETMNGAKNLMHYDSIDDTRTTGTITATLNSDMTITINGTSGDTPAVIGFVFPLKSGEYWLNGCPTDGSFDTYSTDIRNQIYGSRTYGRDTGSGGTVNISDDGNYAYNIRIAANTTINNMIFKPMLIPSDIKNAGFTNYQPYAMSNAELTAKEQQNENNISSKQDKPTVIAERYNTTDTYAYYVTLTIPANRVCKVSAALSFSNSQPRGIAISQSNDSSTFDAIANLIGQKDETTSAVPQLIAEGYCGFNTEKTLYIWAKSASAASNSIFVSVEYLS